jgi:hypothetical protein
METKEKPLNAAFGFDRQARDIADNFSGSYWRGGVQKVMAALASMNRAYRGPRNILRPFMNLTTTAARVFNPMRWRGGASSRSPSVYPAPEPK